MDPGDRVSSRFEIEGKAGAGGMGVVYRARDLTSGSLVALKVLEKDGQLDVERFSREASLLATLNHPAIVRYVAHGLTPWGDRWLAMEWIDGESLSGRLKRGALSEGDALVVVERVADALASAHKRGILHRDLKPANLILPGGDLGRVKLLDFGLARLVSEQLTRTGAMLGTPGYMAPEQVRGLRELDQRADVFALGCILYRCIAGKAPFSGETVMAVLAKILLEETPRLSSVVPGTGRELDELLVRMMDKDPERRPADAGQALAELQKVPRGSSTSSVAEGTARVLSDRERRLVSILLVGPAGREEDGGVQLRVQTIAREHGATVDRLAQGTRLFAFAPQGTAADDAARAARCAIALRDLLPNAAMALATGRSESGDGRTTGAMVDRVTAALACAAPGVIDLDESAASLLEGRFALSRRGEQVVLGDRKEDDPTQPLLLGRRSGFVGRERELGVLQGLWQEVTDEPVSRAAVIIAAPGMGKSRLAAELISRIKAGGTKFEVLSARADVLRAGSPLAMLASVVRRAASIRENDRAEEAITKIAQRLACIPEQDRQRIVALLATLAGIAGAEAAWLPADARARADAIRGAFCEWLEAEAKAAPVLLLLEDLHWGDRPTVEVIGSALRRLAEKPFMVLATARQEVSELFPGLWAERSPQLITLAGLTRKAADRLAREALGTAHAETTITRLVEQADGNAFYLEELIRAVAEGHGQLPETVLGMIQARLDALGAGARRVLRAASVFGRTFWLGGVKALLSPSDAAELGEEIDELLAREMVGPAEGSSLAGEKGMLFRHDLVREAAYLALPEADRRAAHASAAGWLEKAHFRDPLVLAEHYRLAGMGPTAAGWYLKATEAAMAGDDLPGALERARRGVECDPEGEFACKLLLLEADAADWQRDTPRSEAAADKVTARVQKGSAEWFRASDIRLMALMRGRATRLPALMAELLSVDPGPGAQAACVRALAQTLIVYVRSGRGLPEGLEERMERFVPGLPEDVDTRATVLAARSLVARSRGDADRALECVQQGMKLFEEALDLRHSCLNRLSHANLLIELGDEVGATREARAAAAIALRLGSEKILLIADYALSYVALTDKRHREGLERARRMATVGTANGDFSISVLGRVMAARHCLALGDAGGAEAEADQALTISFQPLARGSALAWRSRARLAGGKVETALADARAALEGFPPQSGFEEGESLVRLSLTEALRASGETAAAGAALAEARRRLEERAARIGNPRWRESFLRRVPENAALLAG